MRHLTRLARWAMVLTILALVAASLPITAGASQPEATPQGFGNIQGHVYQADSLAPIYPAKVVVEDQVSGAPVGEFNNFPDGVFYIALPPGTYLLRATATGFAGMFYDGVYNKEEATPVTVASDASTTGIDFVLQPGGSISGQVTSPWDWGLEKMTVKAMPADGSPYFFAVCTDASGNYTIGGVPYGQYKVSAGPGPCGGEDRWLIGWYNNKASSDTADIVQVSALSINVTNINFRLQEGGKIEGCVRDDKWQGILGAWVYAEDYDSGKLVASMQTEDSNGHYCLTGLPSGDYRLYATAPGYVLKYHPNTFNRMDADRISLAAPNQICCFDFQLEPGGTISGRVYEADGTTPIGGARVEAADFETGKPMAFTETAPDGSYQLPSVPTGDYRVSALAAGRVREFYLGVIDPADATYVHVRAGFDTPNTNFSLDIGGTISGTVYNADGSARLPNMMVMAVPTAGGGYEYATCTDAQGGYVIEGLPFGDFKVMASGKGMCGGDARYLKQWYQLKADLDVADLVSPSALEPNPAGIDFRLELGGSISGRVTRASDGQPIEWTMVRVEVFDYNTDEHMDSVETRPDGSYTVVGLPVGDYRVWAWVDNFEYAAKWYNNTYSKAAAAPVHVTSGQTTKLINFSLEAGGGINGEVRDNNGWVPLPGMTVIVKRISDGLEFQACTDDEGRFKLSVPFGDYKAMAMGGGPCGGDPWYRLEWWDNAPDEESARLMEIRETNRWWWATFGLDRAGAITGHVYQANGVDPLAGATVIALDYHCWDCPPRGSAQTWPDGSYTLTVPQGDYRVLAMANGYCQKFYNDTYRREEAQLLHVDVATETSGIDFILEPAGSISGMVYSQDGSSPLPGIEVVAIQVLQGGAPGNNFKTCTDQAGAYELPSIPFGDYKVRAGIGGQSDGSQPDGGGCGGDANYVPEWYSQKEDWSQANIVTLNVATPDRTGINFSLELGGAISGRVTDDMGWGLGEAWVHVRDVESGRFVGEARTNWDGNYLINGLPSGQYLVTAFARDRNRQFYDRKASWESADPVTVNAPNETGGINFALTWAQGKISGDITYTGSVPNPNSHEVHIRVVDLCVHGVEVRHHQIPGPQWYEIPNVGNGTYLVFAFLDVNDDHELSPGDAYAFHGDPSPVTVAGGGWAAGVDIAIDDAAKGLLTGGVCLQASAGDAGATVTVGGSSTLSWQGGGFMLAAAPGSHDVVISKPGYLPATMAGVEVVGMIQSKEEAFLGDALLLIGDANSSGGIDLLDVALVAANFGSAGGAGDVNGDGVVDILDLTLVCINFGKTDSLWLDAMP